VWLRYPVKSSNVPLMLDFTVNSAQSGMVAPTGRSLLEKSSRMPLFTCDRYVSTYFAFPLKFDALCDACYIYRE